MEDSTELNRQEKRWRPLYLRLLLEQAGPQPQSFNLLSDDFRQPSRSSCICIRQNRHEFFAPAVDFHRQITSSHQVNEQTPPKTSCCSLSRELFIGAWPSQGLQKTVSNSPAAHTALSVEPRPPHLQTPV